MATRASALNQNYARTLSLGAITAFSVAGWVNVRTDRNAFSTFWNIDNNASTDVTCLQTATDGVTFEVAHESGPYVTGPAVTVNQWVWFGFIWTGNGGTATLMWRTEAATSFSSSTGTIPSTQTATRLRLFESAWGGEWLNGSIAAVKLWTAALTTAELEREFFTYRPQRPANLILWSPLLLPETIDHSGFGSTLTATGVPTLDPAGPPIAWGGAGNSVVLPLAPSLISVTMSGDLPSISGDLTESSKISATTAGDLPVLTGSITSTSTISATTSGDLPSISGSLTADAYVSVEPGGTLPSISGALTASLTASATLSGTLPALTGSLDAEAILAASMAGDLPSVSGSLTSTSTVSATMAGDLPALTGSVTVGGGEISATIDGTLPSLTGSITADAYVSAEVGGVLPAITASLTMASVYRALSVVPDGPATVAILLDGPALRHAVEGAAIERVVSGAARVTTLLDGPSTVMGLLDGPAVGHDVTGPSTERVLTGVGI